MSPITSNTIAVMTDYLLEVLKKMTDEEEELAHALLPCVNVSPPTPSSICKGEKGGSRIQGRHAQQVTESTSVPIHPLRLSINVTGIECV